MKQYIFVIASRMAAWRSILKMDCVALLAMTMISGAAYALNVDTPLANAGQEARARHLFYEIRCVVCEGESIADSPAEVAQAMRKNVREQIVEGKSDAQIKEFLTRQYGERVLMKPPFENHKMLWLSPGLFLLLGLAAAWWLLVRRKKA